MSPSLPVIEGGFGTITADPPWEYKGGGPVGTGGRGAEFVRDRPDCSAAAWYDLMSLDDLKKMPVSDVAAPNAHLYLWVTNSFIAQGYELVEAWGFNPQTFLTWVKVKKDDPSSPSMKMGWWYRGATEHVIFATRGKVERPIDMPALPTAFMHPRIASHSSKPEGFYSKYVEQVSPGPYLEIFGRHLRPGWTVFGNQLDGEPHVS